jgi:undecaprenyl-diphosphatase
VTALRAAVLGILQGLGEFLPISSSGHLIVAPWLFGWPDSGLSFDVALHLGTLLAVAGAFWRDWLRMAAAFLRALPAGRVFVDPDARLLVYLAIASVPGGIAGLLLDKWAETTFRAPALVAVMMALMGIVLWVADRHARRGAAIQDPAAVSLRDALLVGLAQALAIVPGTSRSGATISAALLLGQRRDAAARFSFLLALPITAGAALVKVPHLLRAGTETGPVVVGMVAAAVSGLLAIRVLLRYVRSRDYLPFVAYRFAFAVLVLAVVFWRGGFLR